jgi:hypothetical protein
MDASAASPFPSSKEEIIERCILEDDRQVAPSDLPVLSERLAPTGRLARLAQCLSFDLAFLAYSLVAR